MKTKPVPAYVLDPTVTTEDAFISIETVQPGSSDAHAVVQREWDGEATGTVREAVQRIRAIVCMCRFGSRRGNKISAEIGNLLRRTI